MAQQTKTHKKLLNDLKKQSEEATTQFQYAYVVGMCRTLIDLTIMDNWNQDDYNTMREIQSLNINRYYEV
jgi:hypothetical protein